MVFPSSKSNKTISLKSNGLNYKHKLSFSKTLIKRTPRMINYIKQRNNYLSTGNNTNMDLYGRAIKVIEYQFDSLFSREHSPINIEESNKTNFAESATKCEKSANNNKKIYEFRDEMEYETRDTQIGKHQIDINGNNSNNMDNISNENSYNENPNVHGEDSMFKWIDCSQIDSQSYSKEHYNIDLSNNNDNYCFPNNQCKNLILQNDNARPEIRKLRSHYEKLKEENKLVREKFESEIEYLKSNNANLQSKYNYLDDSRKYFLNKYNKKKLECEKYKSENEKYKSECEKYKTENEKLEKQINNLESENKLNKSKMENENLKSQIIKSVSKIRKRQSKHKRMKDKKLNLGKKLQSLHSQSGKSSNENFNWNTIKTVLDEKENSEIVEKLIEEICFEIILEIAKSSYYETWKPLGFANPKGYCYLNSVVQVLGSCEDFKMDIYNCQWISTEKTNDSIFVEGLFNLIRAITECNRANLDQSLNIVQQNITESSFGDDVYKCFMNLLTRVSNVVKTNIDRPSDHFTSLPINLSEKAKDNFERFKNRNPGFVFDNFYGQLTFQTVCKLCNYVCNESFQLMKSLPLPVPTSDSSVTLNRCIDLFFNESDVELDEPMKCKCETGSTKSLKSITKLTHGPKYLFAYLNRGSYTYDGDKNNTEVTCDDVNINLKTLEDKSIKYKLISVIDHIGDSAGGHYYCKCSFESDKWWLLNDSQADLLQNKNDIVTKNTIVFLLKKLRELL